MERDKDQEGAVIWHQWLSPWVVPGQAYAKWHRQQAKGEGQRKSPLDEHMPHPRYVEPQNFPD